MGIGRITTNIDEFLGIRKRKLVANGGHDRLLAGVEICIAKRNIRVTTAFHSPVQKKQPDAGKELCQKLGQTLPLGEEESAEVELLPPKMEDIAIVVSLSLLLFFFSKRIERESSTVRSFCDSCCHCWNAKLRKLKLRERRLLSRL